MSTPIRAVVITVSDACASGERADTSGQVLVELLEQSDAEVFAKESSAMISTLCSKSFALRRRGDINS